jgi:ADP-ribose pyrophosphatase
VSNPSTQVLAEGEFVRLLRQGRWEYAQRTNTCGAVVIVAVTPEGKLLFVEQYRVPVQARVIELPAGLAGDEPGLEDEPKTNAARRELVEETGYEAQDVVLLTEGPTSAGLTSELVGLYLATGLRRVGPGGGDEGEEIEVHEIELERAADWLADQTAAGKLVDPKVYAGIFFAQRAGLPRIKRRSARSSTSRR